ncbi:hypothetical protein [Streptomyces atroolivaceus]|uniref:hypothetical protein n=1 Tax=Streptomyces atroolivaceus TaxID=66869 RepID=UPI0037A00261
MAATGIFHFSGPCAMADDLVTRLQDAQWASSARGQPTAGGLSHDDGLRCPAAVAEAAEWWSAEDVAKGLAATAALGEKRSCVTPP